MKIVLISATKDDYNWLEDLRREVYLELFKTTWGNWDEGRHQRHWKSCWELGNISILSINDSLVGMVQLISSNSLVEIAEIQIHPKYQNKGYGTAVLRLIIQHAQSDKKEITLSTGLFNRAIHLYERVGFKVTSRNNHKIYMSF